MLRALITVAAMAAGLLPLAAPGQLAGSPAAFGVSFDVEARVRRSSGDVAVFPVEDGGVLRSGDEVRLRLAAREDVYVYVIAYGSSGSAVLLHPFSRRAEDALVRGGAAVQIPSDGTFLPLDRTVGREALYAVAAREPIADLTRLLVRMEATGTDLDAATEVVRARFPDARRVSFRHLGPEALAGISPVSPSTVPLPTTPSFRSLDEPASARSGLGASTSLEAPGGGSPGPSAYEEQGVLSAEGSRIRAFTGETPAPRAAAPVPAVETLPPPRPEPAPPVEKSGGGGFFARLFGAAEAEKEKAPDAPLPPAQTFPLIAGSPPPATQPDVSLTARGGAESGTAVIAPPEPAVAESGETRVNVDAINSVFAELENRDPTPGAATAASPAPESGSGVPASPPAEVVAAQAPAASDSPAPKPAESDESGGFFARLFGAGGSSDGGAPPPQVAAPDTTSPPPAPLVTTETSSAPGSSTLSPPPEPVARAAGAAPVSAAKPAPPTDASPLPSATAGRASAASPSSPPPPAPPAPASESSSGFFAGLFGSGSESPGGAPGKVEPVAAPESVAAAKTAPTPAAPSPAKPAVVAPEASSAAPSPSGGKASTGAEAPSSGGLFGTLGSLFSFGGASRESGSGTAAAAGSGAGASPTAAPDVNVAGEPPVESAQDAPFKRVTRDDGQQVVLVPGPARPPAPPAPAAEPEVLGGQGKKIRALLDGEPEVPAAQAEVPAVAASGQVPPSRSEPSAIPPAPASETLTSAAAPVEPTVGAARPVVAAPASAPAPASTPAVPAAGAVVEPDGVLAALEQGALDSGSPAPARLAALRPPAPALPVEPVREIDLSAADNIAAAVVLVVTPLGSASGVVVDPAGYVLTSWDVVEGFPAVSVVFKDAASDLPDERRLHTARVIRHSRFADLALLELESPPDGLVAAPLGESASLREGSVLHTIGQPGARWRHTIGQLDTVKENSSWYSTRRILHRGTVLRARVLDDPGSESAPVFNNRLELVGLSAGARAKKGLSTAVAADTIRAFLQADGG